MSSFSEKKVLLSEGQTDTLSFSYGNDTLFSFELPNGVIMRLQSSSPSSAHLFFEDANGEEVRCPKEIMLRDFTNGELVSPEPILRFAQPAIYPSDHTTRFFLSASDAFAIFYDDQFIVNFQPVKTWQVQTLSGGKMEKSTRPYKEPGELNTDGYTPKRACIEAVSCEKALNSAATFHEFEIKTETDETKLPIEETQVEGEGERREMETEDK